MPGALTHRPWDIPVPGHSLDLLGVLLRCVTVVTPFVANRHPFYYDTFYCDRHRGVEIDKGTHPLLHRYCLRCAPRTHRTCFPSSHATPLMSAGPELAAPAHRRHRPPPPCPCARLWPVRNWHSARIGRRGACRGRTDRSRAHRARPSPPGPRRRRASWPPPARPLPRPTAPQPCAAPLGGRTGTGRMGPTGPCQPQSGGNRPARGSSSAPADPPPPAPCRRPWSAWCGQPLRVLRRCVDRAPRRTCTRRSRRPAGPSCRWGRRRRSGASSSRAAAGKGGVRGARVSGVDGSTTQPAARASKPASLPVLPPSAHGDRSGADSVQFLRSSRTRSPIAPRPLGRCGLCAPRQSPSGRF
mmetsp:Transcript_30259/g.97707  ORF Transcript_30259/g.97707 Transcript_30259/m.97707 type:complete len:356 (-) Transcript_30259:555-1622(-)